MFAKRLVRDCRKLPDQIIANEYFPGRGISAHVDCIPRFDDAIGSISPLSACEMFSRSARTGTCAVLQPRSGGLPMDSGRFDWTHEVSARKSDIVTGVRTVRSRRISLTFRKVIASTSTLAITNAPDYPYSAPPGPDKVLRARAASGKPASSPS
ncbi:hypothetical protein [Agrobacterium tumefaciens]|uniref:hypothetical protein n=1 Tax=Agrobacterium tumefaciens TaxID=358 RepID=UPI003CC7E774